MKYSFTSACIQQLSPLDEAQVACPGPQSVGLPKAESGVEMICLQALFPVDGVVATGAMRTIHPDLNEDRVSDYFCSNVKFTVNAELTNLSSENNGEKPGATLRYHYDIILSAHSPPQDVSLPVGLWSLG